MSLLFKDVYRILTLADKVLIATLALLSAASFGLVGVAAESGEYAIIAVDGGSPIRKSLHRDDLFILPATTGAVVIEIQDQSIRILDSNCAQKLCIRQGRIKRVGEIIVCVPNKITIWIEGRQANPFDAITG
jgi:hypothetical protein